MPRVEWAPARSIATSLKEEQASKPRGRKYLEKLGKAQLKTEHLAQGSSTRGWRLDAPKTQKERKDVKEHCGQKCFLGPNLSYPICRKVFDGKAECRFDRRGVISAKHYAERYGQESIAKKAAALLKS